MTPAVAHGLSRRQLVQSAAGLSVLLLVPPTFLGATRPVHAQDSGKPVGAWVTIAPDNTITIAAPAAEMGQGVMTALPLIFAEELGADWSKVRAVFSPPNAQIYGNPAWGGILLSVGSKTCEGYWDKIRLQAAAVRMALINAAASQWSVPPNEVTTDNGVLVHGSSGRRISFGELAARIAFDEKLPEVQPANLKKRADYRLLGQPHPRFDIPPKVDGSALYGMDVRLPGMAYATVLRAPVEGAEPDEINSAETGKIQGIIKIFPIAHAVAIAAETMEAALAGRDALKVTWKKGAIQGWDSEAELRRFADRARDGNERGLPYVNSGNTDQAFSSAAKVITGEYATDYLYHAQMEPMNITAAVADDGGSAELWLGTQAQSATLGAAAQVLNIGQDKLQLHQQFLGGGFGRRGMTDLVPEVLAIAKEIRRPVKLMWTRDTDVKSARMRPMTAHQLQVAMDGQGNVTGWKHRLVAESVLYYRGPKALEQVGGLDNIVLEGAKHPYDIANQRIEYVVQKTGTPLSAWRGIGAGYNKFAIESFIDEIAAQQNVDPVELRRRLVKNNPRALAVINKTAEMAGWGRKPENGRALGFSFGQIVNSWTAGVVEISLDNDTGEIRAHQFWTAIDAGTVINPDTIRAQTEGNVVFGLSQALRESVTLKDGQVQQSNYNDYPVLRLADVPEIHIEILPTDNPPTGIGEAALPLVACCVGNAFFALTGKRLRALPMSPPRVKAALAARSDS